MRPPWMARVHDKSTFLRRVGLTQPVIQAGMFVAVVFADGGLRSHVS